MPSTAPPAASTSWSTAALARSIRPALPMARVHLAGRLRRSTAREAGMVIQSEEIRARQAPLKERYRQEPAAAKIRLEVKSDPTLTAEPMLTRVGNELLTAESAAHAGVGGPGNVGCSGDVLLAALAACQEITLKLVA